MTHTVAPIRRKSAVEVALLIQLGKQIRRARRSRNLKATLVAKRIGIPCITLRSVECGKPSVPMATFLKVFVALGVADDIFPPDVNAAALSAVLARRHAALEAQVVAGLRNARSLVSIPARMAVQARVTFPEDAFGKPEPW